MNGLHQEHRSARRPGEEGRTAFDLYPADEHDLDSSADGYAQAALFTLLILPPPFIIPLDMKTGVEDERKYVNNVLSLYTLVSIVVLIA